MSEEQDKVKLKPCPFCGSKAEVNIYDDNHGPLSYSIVCTNLDCEASQQQLKGSKGKEKVIAAWNIRANALTAEQKEMVIRLCDELLTCCHGCFQKNKDNQCSDCTHKLAKQLKEELR